MMLQRFAHAIILLDGWSRRGVAFLAGALGALAMAPFGAFPVLFVSFPIAVWLIDGTEGEGGRLLPALRSAFSVGWWFGFGYFLAGLWWIGAAFLVDPAFTWALPFAVLALPIGLAIFTAIGFAAARLFWSRGWSRIVVFGVALSIAEYLRGHLFTGFPWNSFGYALAEWLAPAQVLAWIGISGLTLVTLLIFAMPATLADMGTPKRPTVVAGLLLAVLFALGGARLALIDVGTVDKVALRLMQPNVPQDQKFRPEARDAILAKYFELSDRATSPQTPGLSKVTYLLWPESAFPFIVSRDADALAQIGSLLPANTTLITGAGRMEEGLGDEDPARYFNSVHVIDSTGAISDSRDKVHLVPFGEYLPFQSILEAIGLRQLTQLRGGFSAGARLRTLDLRDAPPVGILICYEVIFSGAVIDSDARPGWLLNVTNDAWFGQTPGPWQHLAQARARAIEEGLPLVRVANDGISAVFDPVGRVLAESKLGVVDVIDSTLPKSLPATVFSQFRDRVFVSLLVLCVLFCVAANFMKPRRKFSL